MTNYERGLEKLGLYGENCILSAGSKWICSRGTTDCKVRHNLIDLRTDPAFAWRVFCALRQESSDAWIAYCRDLTVLAHQDMGAILYAAVEALGSVE